MTTYPRILSIANFLFYLLNALETFGFGPFSARYESDQDNATISRKYQTIITPFGVAFSIWAIIFISEAICVIVMLLSDYYRSHPLAVDGISWWFAVACLMQTAWSPAFAYEKIPLSAIIMGCILAPLTIIIIRQYRVVKELTVGKRRDLASSENMSLNGSDYWLLQFPFELHCGWITAAFVLNLNIVLVSTNVLSGGQFGAAVASLLALAAVGLRCLFLKRPNYTIPWVLVWATFWIVISLKNPMDVITQKFSNGQINSMSILSGVLCSILAIITLLRWAYCRFIVSSSSNVGVGSQENKLLKENRPLGSSNERLMKQEFS